MRGIRNKQLRAAFVALVCFLLLAVTRVIAADERTFADLKVNDAAAGEALVTVLPDDLLVPIAALEKAGLHDLAGKRVDAGGETLVSLRSLAPGITYTFDQDQLVVTITAKLSYLGTTTFNLAQTAAKFPISDGAGSGYLNYAVTRQTGGGDAFNGEFGMSRGPGVLLGAFHDDQTTGFRRDQTRYVIDDPLHTRTLTLGDSDVNTAYAGDPLAGNVSVGGVTLGRNGALNPNAVRNSGAGLTGTASSPSTVEVYVNGALTLREDVAPGSFSLNALPLTEGQNNTQVVIRDAFGRTQTIDQAFYMATELLPKGATDYSYSLGVLHEPYGTTASYGPSTALARYALGVHNDLTLGGRVEAEPRLLSTGATLGYRTRFGLFGAAAALSKAGGLGGCASDINYTYAQRGMSFSADVRGQTAYYATTSQGTDVDRALHQMRINLTKSLGKQSLSFSYLTQMFRDDLTPHAEITLSDTMRLGDFGFTVGQTLYRNGATAASGIVMNLTTMLGRTRITAGNSLSSGTPTRTLDITRDVPPSGGLGYQIQDQEQNGTPDLRQETVTYRGRYGVADAVFDGAQLSTLGLSGGLAFADKTAVFTQPVSGSFGIIESGVPGVGATVNNQYLGRTDAQGRIFAPNLFPYVRNQIDLAAEDAPLDNQLVDPHKTIVPRAGAGVAIRLESHRIQAYTGIVDLLMPNGHTRIPSDGTLTLHDSDADYRSDLGEDGAYYFDYLKPGSYDAKILSGAGSCSFVFHADPTRGPLTRMGVQSCSVTH